MSVLHHVLEHDPIKGVLEPTLAKKWPKNQNPREAILSIPGLQVAGQRSRTVSAQTDTDAVAAGADMPNEAGTADSARPRRGG